MNPCSELRLYGSSRCHISCIIVEASTVLPAFINTPENLTSRFVNFSRPYLSETYHTVSPSQDNTLGWNSELFASIFMETQQRHIDNPLVWQQRDSIRFRLPPSYLAIRDLYFQLRQKSQPIRRTKWRKEYLYINTQIELADNKSIIIYEIMREDIVLSMSRGSSPKSL